MTEAEAWRSQHRAVQRALCELEGAEYVEPQPRWVRFATLPPSEPPALLCTICGKGYNHQGWLDSHFDSHSTFTKENVLGLVVDGIPYEKDTEEQA